MKLKNDFGVRALMGTIVVSSGSLVMGYLAYTGNDAAIGIVGATMGMVIGFYFGQRSKGGSNGVQETK